MAELMGGGFGVVVMLFLFLLALLWFLLPFAIFGTKDKLAALIAESKKTNVELARIASELAAARSELAARKPQSQIAGEA